MQKTEDFIAGIERDVKVIEAVREILVNLELLSAIAVEVQGEKYRLSFSRQINALKVALRIMGVRDDEKLPPTTAMRLNDRWQDGKGDY